MKVRSGFVSNSSSSSFIISNEFFDKTSDLATYMIGKQIEEDGYGSSEDIKKWNQENRPRVRCLRDF